MTTTQTETFTDSPTEDVLCAQIGRWWAAQTSGGGALTFVEADDDTPGNIYAAGAGGMPIRAHRLSPGISITPTAAPISEDGALRRIGVNIAVRDATMARCIARLRQIRAWLMPDERSLVLASNATTLYGQLVGRVIGRPTIDSGDSPPYADLWAIVIVEPLQSITPVSSGGPGNQTDEGEALATMSLMVSCYPVRVRSAVELFTATYAGVAGIVQLGRGTITINATHCITTSNDPTGTTSIVLAGKTIAQLRAAIAAVTGWSTANGAGVNDALDATLLPAMAETDAVVAEGGPARIYGNPQTIDANLG